VNAKHHAGRGEGPLKEKMEAGDRDSSRLNSILAAVAFLTAVLLYGLTAAPGVLWQDSAMFQHRVYFNDLRGESGLPLAHPLYILLARGLALALPFENFAFRVNLFSALCGACAVAVAMRLLLNLTRSRTSAVVGTIALAVSHTFWTHSVIAEVYNLYALGLLIELYFVERFLDQRQFRWLAFALFANGLSISNHLLALLHTPAYLTLILWSLRSRAIRVHHLAGAAGAFLLGVLPYGVLIAKDIADGGGVFETLKLAAVGPEERANKVLALTFSPARQLVRTAQFFLMNFPTPLLMLGPIGLWQALRHPRTRQMAIFCGIVFAVDFVFAFRYPVPDQFVFFTPCYVLTALGIGLGAEWLMRPLQRRTGTGDAVSVPPHQKNEMSASRRTGAAIVAASGVMMILGLLPIAVYAAAPTVFRSYDISIGAKREIPYRDTLAYFIQPWKCGENSARRFAEEALQAAAPDGLLYADTTIKNVLVYVRDIEGHHRGVTLTTGHDTFPRPPVIDRTPEAVEPFVRAGKAFICSDAPDYVPAWIRERWDIEPAGIIFKIVPRRGE